MSEYKEIFINELGNKITISVSEKEIESIKGILLHIVGPASEIENHMTLEEVKVLRKLLTSLLNNL